jgi:hypothetical protein
MLIKPFIGRVERRDADVDDAKLADRPVAAEGLDQDCSERADGNCVTIQFHVTPAFEDQVDLRVPLVVVHLRVLLDVHDMDRGGGVVRYGQGPPGIPAGTSHCFDVIEMSYNVIGQGFSSHDYTRDHAGGEPVPAAAT